MDMMFLLGWLGGIAAGTFILWWLLRTALVTPDDFSNAPFEKMRSSKKLCDFAISFCGLVICSVHTIAEILSLMTLVPNIFHGDPYAFVLCLVLIPCGIAVLIFATLAKTEKIGVVVSAVIMSVEIAALMVLGEKGDDNMFYVFMICAGLLVILNYARIYNSKLKQQKGYPFYNNHEERMAQAAADQNRITAKENYYRSQIDAESLLNGDKKTVEDLKPKPQKVSVSADAVDIEEYFKQVDRQRQETKDSDGSDKSDWLSG